MQAVNCPVLRFACSRLADAKDRTGKRPPRIGSSRTLQGVRRDLFQTKTNWRRRPPSRSSFNDPTALLKGPYTPCSNEAGNLSRHATAKPPRSHNTASFQGPPRQLRATTAASQPACLANHDTIPVAEPVDVRIRAGTRWITDGVRKGRRHQRCSFCRRRRDVTRRVYRNETSLCRILPARRHGWLLNATDRGDVLRVGCTDGA